MVIRQEFIDATTKDFDIELCEFDDTTPNHVHLLVSDTPNISPREIVSRLKQYSAYKVWQQLPEFLSKFCWKKHYLWTRGYFVASIGEVSESTIRQYIENQG